MKKTLQAGHPLAAIWRGMMSRCHSETSPKYKNYGGRGISVCERWHRFEWFVKDMGPRPSPQHSIDRIDNDDDYFPENCRWALPKEQCRNTRRNRNLTIGYVTKSVSAWSEEAGTVRSTIYQRLDRGLGSETAVLAAPYDVPRKTREVSA